MPNDSHAGVGTTPGLRLSASGIAGPGATCTSISSLIAALLASSLALPANAAAADLTELSLEQLLNIEVAGASKFPQKVSDAPSAVSIVTAADIETHGYRTLGDVLHSIRGLYVTNDRNYLYLGVRGFSRPGDYNSRVLLLIDGNRVNETVYGGGLIGNAALIDVDLIERVEFVPGPGSAVYGSAAFFGVVNVVTKDGGDIGRTELSAEAASADTAKGRVTYGKRHDNGLDMVLSATTYGSDGRDIYFPEFDDPATNNGVARDLDHNRAKQFFAKLRHGDYSVSAAYVARHKGIPTASFEQVFNDPRSSTLDEQAMLDLRVNRQLADTLRLSANLYFGLYRYDADLVYFDALSSTVSLNHDVGVSKWWGTELRFLDTSLARHRIVYGGEYRSEFRQDQGNYDIEPDYLVYLDDRRRGQIGGLYVQDEYTHSERWTLTGGLRYDRDNQSANRNAFNPRLAVIHRPGPETTAKLLYGTAFRAPNVYEKYYYKQNPDLHAEKIRTVEGVLERYLRGDLRFTGSLFYYRIENLVSLTTDPADGSLVFLNIDQVEAKGVELEIERRWAGDKRLRASYTWLRAENSMTAAELTNSPRQIAKINASQPLLDRALRVGVDVQYMSERETPSGATVGDHTLVGLTLSSIELAKNLDMSVSVYNLFDRQFGDPPSEEHLDSLGRLLNEIPQDGRSYRLKLRYGF